MAWVHIVGKQLFNDDGTYAKDADGNIRTYSDNSLAVGTKVPAPAGHTGDTEEAKGEGMTLCHNCKVSL
tara:strand:+ start:1540 stop:1746 length:207 start_codon:yes stop_codon:yes gene_type:complete